MCPPNYDKYRLFEGGDQVFIVEVGLSILNYHLSAGAADAAQTTTLILFIAFFRPGNNSRGI